VKRSSRICISRGGRSRARLEGELDAYVSERYAFVRPVPSYVEVGTIPTSSALALPRATARVIPIALRRSCARRCDRSQGRRHAPARVPEGPRHLAHR